MTFEVLQNLSGTPLAIYDFAIFFIRLLFGNPHGFGTESIREFYKGCIRGFYKVSIGGCRSSFGRSCSLGFAPVPAVAMVIVNEMSIFTE